jgi:hypothetical protein
MTIPYLSISDLIELVLPETRHYRGAVDVVTGHYTDEFYAWLRKQAQAAMGHFLITVIVALILYWVVEKKLELF